MEKRNYVMSSVEEYFAILDREQNERRSILAKLFVKYLR